MITVIIIAGRDVMRYSRQREALHNLLCSTKTHPDAEWLYLNLKKSLPNLSLGTVYRNLKQMAENGEILEISCKNSTHYDGDISRHYHIFCENCGKILDLPREYISVSVEKNNIADITGYDVLFQGICFDCKK